MKSKTSAVIGLSAILVTNDEEKEQSQFDDNEIASTLLSLHPSSHNSIFGNNSLYLELMGISTLYFVS